jgi:indole-3-glycerol phosphate synthase
LAEQTYLDRILEAKREEVAARKVREPLDALRARMETRAHMAEHSGEHVSLARQILRKPGHLGLIAEIKKASPSKGRLVSVLEHRAVARTYAIGGAAGISVLTEETYFQGRLEYLSDVRAAQDGYYPGGRPAILRKDFLFDPYQVYESKAHGADAVLLIVAILDDDRLRELLALAAAEGLECLVEVHDEGELRRALDAGAFIIGVNNRDLRTFNTDLAVTERLRPLVPDDRVVISESGILGRAEAERVKAAGVHGILVGEALMTASNVREKMREYMV